MISNLYLSAGSESYQQLQKFYYHYADLRTLNIRLKFRELRRAYYTELWRQAALNVGAHFSEWRNGYSQISRDGQTTMVYQMRVMLNSNLAERILIHKSLTQELLDRMHHPIPRFVLFTSGTIDVAKEFLDRNGRIVVKPAGGTSGGRGITTSIDDNDKLAKAARMAARYDSKLIAEEHIQGDSYRLLYLGGRFLDAIRRLPPIVSGDGKNTIRALVKKENIDRLTSRPPRALTPLLIDQDCNTRLRDLGLTANSVLDQGRSVRIKNVANENDAAQNENVREIVHPEVIESGRRIVCDMGLTLAGIDLQCADISRPLVETGGRFIEVNAPVGIHYHYLIANPQHGVRVAEILLDYMFTHREGVMVL